MTGSLDFLIRHGASVLFAVVFIEEIGVPLPAAPWLLAAGALAGTGQLHWAGALAAATVASILADMVWFYLGRYAGDRILRLLCRITLEPDSCTRRTQEFFTRYGMPGVVMAKFIPGIGTLAPPMAGSSGVSVPRFLIFDGLASLLHAGSFMLIGGLFHHQLTPILNALASLGKGAITVAVALAMLYIGYKYVQRRRLLNELRMARITVDELREKQKAGESLLILDLRSLMERTRNPALIPGALQMTLEEVQVRDQEIPRDREIILYCSCPNEVSSARAALLLHRKGIRRVRPLLGGIDAWRERNYPLETRDPDAAIGSGAGPVIAPIQPVPANGGSLP